MTSAGGTAVFRCSVTNSSYPAPFWHFYGLTPGAKPCGFDSSALHPGISLCPSAVRLRRTSVTYSSSSPLPTSKLTIISAQLSDAGIYTCGHRNPNVASTSSSVIFGVIGKPIHTNKASTITVITCFAPGRRDIL